MAEVLLFTIMRLPICPIFKRAQLGLGYLPQEPSIFKKLTVYDNIYAILELRYDDVNYITEKRGGHS